MCEFKKTLCFICTPHMLIFKIVQDCFPSVPFLSHMFQLSNRNVIQFSSTHNTHIYYLVVAWKTLPQNVWIENKTLLHLYSSHALNQVCLRRKSAFLQSRFIHSSFDPNSCFLVYRVRRDGTPMSRMGASFSMKGDFKVKKNPRLFFAYEGCDKKSLCRGLKFFGGDLVLLYALASLFNYKKFIWWWNSNSWFK